MSEQGNMGQPAKKQGKGKRKGARPWGQLSKTAAGTWRAAYIGPDGARHIPAESWAVKPINPLKITNKDATTPLTPDQVLTAGQVYNARVTASSNGYAQEQVLVWQLDCVFSASSCGLSGTVDQPIP